MSDLKPLSLKAPMHLLPARPLRAIVAAIEHGAIKYEPWNWQDMSKNKERIDELVAALLRHVTAAADPAESDYDEESGLHHMMHAGACVILAIFKMGLDYKPSRFKLMTPDELEAERVQYTGLRFSPEGPAVVSYEIHLEEADYDALRALITTVPPEIHLRYRDLLEKIGLTGSPEEA